MEARVTVRFVSGREEHFEVELFGGGKSAEIRLKEFVRDPTLVLQVDNDLVIIPANAIECITVTLPAEAAEQISLENIRKAKRLKPSSM